MSSQIDLSHASGGAWVLLSVALALACDRAPEPKADHAPRAPAPTAPSAEELPASWRLPLGWRWETNTQEGFTAAFPALPLVDRAGQRLVGRTNRSEAAVSVAPEGNGFVQRYRREVEQRGWSVRADQPLGRGHALDVVRAGLITHTRFVPGPTHTFVLTFTTAEHDDADATTFLDTFVPRGTPEHRAVRVAPGLAVVVPARASEFEERSETPILRGLAGLRDGVQFSALTCEIPAGNLESAIYLESALRASLAQLGGQTLSETRAAYHGAPSIRVEHRGATGVYVVRRIVATRGRFVDVGVYAAGGEEPPWADAFVDSLEID